ncbi:MAG: S-ribosylhomocysteine lyase [Erysipelotrichaceae bacterium]|nr:S-ribosylhomocysteine lyase [Erysipelotrichaceae bacterium]MDP3306523.1 S-ribosylhomocysteine lyase [Erysipelotrichaceae bacterium]
MEKIKSFTVNHLTLIPGIYESRRDPVGNSVVVTYDIRMIKPNVLPVMENAQLHTIEHLGATFLRNHSMYKDKIIYFGPMGCRTGFYLLVGGDIANEQLFVLIKDMFKFIRTYDQEIPGTKEIECGNYLDHDLKKANEIAENFLNDLYMIDDTSLVYPE